MPITIEQKIVKKAASLLQEQRNLTHDALYGLLEEEIRVWLETLLWNSKHPNIDFDPSRSKSDNFMWVWRSTEEE